MDESSAKNDRAEKSSDVEFEPAWPQRPDRPRPEPVRPRLDPPEGLPPVSNHKGNGGFGDTEIQPSRWTSHPTSYSRQPGMASNPGDTKETQVLPIVESSRFDNGRVAPQAPQTPQQARLSPPTSQSRPQPRPVQPPSRPQNPPQYPLDAEYDYAPTMPYAQPQTDYDYDDYDPGSYGYDQQVARAQPGQRRAVPSPASQGRGGRRQEPGLQYGAVAVEAKRKPKWRWIVWTFGGIIAILAIVVIAVSLAWQGQYAGKIYTGVRVLDTDLGGKTQEEARKLLDDKVQTFIAQPVVLKWGAKEWRPTAEQVGLHVDTASTVSEAFARGRDADFFGNIQEQLGATQLGYGVPLNVQFSEPALQNYLKTVVAAETDQKLFEGDVRLNGAEVVALPGKEGRSLDVYGAIVAVRDSLAQLKPGAQIELPVEVVQPTVSADEVAQIQNLLTMRVSGPITATAPTKTFTLDREALVRFTTIERNPDRTAPKHVELGWRDNELKILADKWAAEASRPAQNAKFDWKGGSVSIVRESIDGLQVDPATVLASIKEHADTADKRQYDMPGKVLTPTVSSKDMGALGIKDQLGQGLSTFKGSSPERATNIRVAAALLDGNVVPPGGTFSFLDAMGGIDESHGFVPGYVIAAERTQLGVGGGVCQASTTTFRAAFWAGLPITERNQHSYRVSWYEADGQPVGFDAAVFDPGVDLKFVNNTPGYILIKAITGPDSLTVTVYGTKQPGEVKLEGPVISNKVAPPSDVYEVDPRLASGTKKQVETAHGGLDTVITRRIVVPGQPDKVDQFHSSYKAWPNWYIVASPSQIPAGAQPTQAAAAAKP